MYLRICLLACLSAYLCIHPSIHKPVCQSIHPSVLLSFCPSTVLSVSCSLSLCPIVSTVASLYVYVYVCLSVYLSLVYLCDLYSLVSISLGFGVRPAAGQEADVGGEGEAVSAVRGTAQNQPGQQGR